MSAAPVPFVRFVETVLGVRLHPAQSVLCRVAFDGIEPSDLEGDDRGLARQLFGETETIPTEARAVLVAVCGARSGKSRVLGALYSLWRALTADLTALAPGELAVALIVCPDLRLARQTLRFALGAAKAVPSIARLIEGESADALTLRRPDEHVVSLEALPATRGGSALRGRSLVSAVLDECAFFRDESFQVNDQELFRAVAPRILPGGLIVVCSTPWAESGLLYDEFSRNHGHPVTALAALAPTDVMNPAKRAEVERERARDPENARREFDAEFMPMGSGLFFDGNAIDQAIDRALTTPLSSDGARGTAVGGDLGLVRDSSAFVAVQQREGFFVPAEVVELRPEKGAPLKLSVVCATGAEFARRHAVGSIAVDHHALEPAREHMPDDVALDAIEGGQDAKVARYILARSLLNEGRLRVPSSERRLIQQMREVIARPTPGGGLQITLPRRAGAHGDVLSAFVVALAAIAGDRVFTAARLERVTRAEPVELARQERHRYAAGLHMGTRGDSWALVIGTCYGTPAHRREVVAVAHEWTRPGDSRAADALAKVASLLAPFGITYVWAESWTCEALASAERPAGVRLVPRDFSTEEISTRFDALRVQADAGDLELAPVPALRAALLRVQKRVSRAGVRGITAHGADGRADLARALVLAFSASIGAPEPEPKRALNGPEQWRKQAERDVGRRRREEWRRSPVEAMRRAMGLLR